MKKVVALAVSLIGVSCLAQESTLSAMLDGLGPASMPVKLLYSVDLAKPGAYDRLQRDNPEHYAKVITVARAASAPSCVEDLKVLKVALRLDDVNCAAMTTLASYPPKRNVSVMIDGVHYMTFAEIGFQPAKSVPLLHAPGVTAPPR